VSAPAAQIRVQEALELLGRASQDWRNGTAEDLCPRLGARLFPGSAAVQRRARRLP
jgi:hypothetical protein